MIQVVEDGKDDPFHAVSIVENTHGSGPSSDLSKGSLDEVSGSNFSPQGLLGSLKLFGIKSPCFLLREPYLIKAKQIIDLSLQTLNR
jgi:hypothetical protein